jgi:DNA-binding response OmpR family regulator
MPSVLIVEDDAALCEGFAMVFKADGFDARTVGNGVEGLAMLATNWRPDVILLDLMMPRMCGRQFRQVLAREPRFADIPVVVMSAHGELADQIRGLDFAGVLQKPFRVDHLLNTVRLAVKASGDAVARRGSVTVAAPSKASAIEGAQPRPVIGPASGCR